MKQYHDSVTVIHSANNKPVIRINHFEQHNNTSALLLRYFQSSLLCLLNARFLLLNNRLLMAN
jgi:hypothetical protein